MVFADKKQRLWINHLTRSFAKPLLAVVFYFSSFVFSDSNNRFSKSPMILFAQKFA